MSGSIDDSSKLAQASTSISIREMTMEKKLVFWAGAFALALAGLTGVTSASAATLVDRGLPTANLNNAAGPNRSNVAWLFTGYTPADYWLVGDTFTNTSSDAWSINTIRLWSMKATESASLWGGIDGSPTIGVVSSSGAISDATYADSTNYQGSSGAFRDMHQIDFAVDITLAAGQKYDFFFDGRSSDSGYTLAYAHASNAALSGSPQDGADDSMLYAQVLSGILDPSSVGTWTSLGNGWDKASDVNVQVFGNVPEPGTLTLLGLGLAGLGFARRKKA